MDALSIAVPQELWLLMGIAATSLIGSPLIKGVKKGQPVEGDQRQASEQQRTAKPFHRPGLSRLGGAAFDPGLIPVWLRRRQARRS